MRALQIALTALALRASATKPPRAERRLAPAVDKPDAAALDRRELDQQHAALIASLWPEARPCVVPALYLELPAPALLGAVLQVSWCVPIGELLATSADAPCREGAARVAAALAA